MKKTLFTAFILFMYVMVSGQTQEQLAIKKQIQHEFHHPEIIKKSYSNISKSSAYNFYGESPDWNWSQTFGGWGIDYINDIKTDEIGNYYICGSFSGEISYDGNTYNSSGFKDGFIAKLNSSWQLQWFKQIEAGSKKKAEINSIDLDESGNIYATGYFTGILDLNGTTLTGNDYKSAVIIKLDNSGMFQLEKMYAAVDVDKSGKKYIQMRTVISTSSLPMIYLNMIRMEILSFH